MDRHELKTGSTETENMIVHHAFNYDEMAVPRASR
jgi:hypothetical protein